VNDGTTDRGAARLTLAAMTLASSMILVDQTSVPLAIPRAIGDLDAAPSLSQWVLTANVLPLAAFMVLGGRLGDLRGLRRMFVAGAVVFTASSALAGAAQSIEWLIAARVAQGIGAALMMPNALAIVSNVFPAAERGRALGVLAGASAFFAAAGPVLGGLLTSIDWRMVFLVNVPLAVATVAIALRATPDLRTAAEDRRSIDVPGTIAFAVGAGGVVLGLGQGPAVGWDSPGTIVPLAVGAVALAIFFVIEARVRAPLLELPLFRHLNFLASNVSQTLAGSVELGLGFLLPMYLLLAIGLDPETAGLALIPATIPVLVFGPLAGRAFDRLGGRPPLVVGFLILAGSSVYLAIVLSELDYGLLVPGLVLQGIGLGIVLTVNDPVGLAAVPERDRGEASGVINTTEQLGGALGIAGLWAALGAHYHSKLGDLLTRHGIDPTPEQVDRFRQYLQQAEEVGRRQAEPEFERFREFLRSGEGASPADARRILDDAGDAFIGGFEVALVLAAAIALVGALSSALLVRRGDRVAAGPVFGRRSRWVQATAGRSPAITRQPPPPGAEPAE
jgi:EmrB/QacA subfamily drug resistance transporter